MPRDGSAVKAGNACPKAHSTNAKRLAGPKSPPQNAVSFQMQSMSGPCGPDVHGPADDADFSKQNSNPIGATRRPTRPCACRAPAIRDPPTWGAFDTKKWPHGCDKVRSCYAVTIVSGTAPRAIETFRGGRGTQASKAGRHPSKQGRPAPKQARPAGTRGRQAPKAGREAEGNKHEQRISAPVTYIVYTGSQELQTEKRKTKN